MKIPFKIFLQAILFSMLFISCQKHNCQNPKSSLTEAIITGNDLRNCACCGGLMITFSNNATPYSEKFYDIDLLPSNSGINESSAFPIYVRVKYETPTTSCGGHVNILTLEKR